MRQPVAYLRKSRVTNDRHVSWEVQLDAVKKLALHHGEPEPHVLSDWNKSGRKGPEGRPGYRELIAMIEAGEVSTLYSYSLSRLSRSLSEFARLVEICRAHDVTIRLHAEPFLDFTSAAGRLMVSILAAFAQMEAEIAQERARDTAAIRRARGDKMGREDFADAQVVIDAFEEAGSVSGAAKLLTLRGVPTRNGNTIWWASSVKVILNRVAPEMLPQGKAQGVKKAAPFYFYRLLRCHCGATLTAVRYHSQRGNVMYRCARGQNDPLHGRQSVPEGVVMEWAREEAALMCPPDVAIQIAENAEERKNALLERKRRAGKAFGAGAMDDEEFEEEVGQIDRELAAIDAEGRIAKLEGISWDRDPKLVNGALRTLWSHIQLDENQKPVFAEWRLPDWRRDAGAPGSPAARVA